MKEMGPYETVRCRNPDCNEAFNFFKIGYEIAQEGDPQAKPYNAECPFCHVDNKILIKIIDIGIWATHPKFEGEDIPLKPLVPIGSAFPFHKRVPFQPDPFPIPMIPLHVTRKLEYDKIECCSPYTLQNIKTPNVDNMKGDQLEKPGKFRNK
jgi:hypothetical protein